MPKQELNQTKLKDQIEIVRIIGKGRLCEGTYLEMDIRKLVDSFALCKENYLIKSSNDSDIFRNTLDAFMNTKS